MRTFLPFEEPIEKLATQIADLEKIEEQGDANVTKSIQDLQKKLDKKTKEVYR